MSPPTLSGNGPVHWETCFTSSGGALHGPLSHSILSGGGSQLCTRQRKPGTATSFVWAPAPRHLALSQDLGNDILPSLASPTPWGVLAFMTCTLSPQRYFLYLVFHGTELKLRLETVNFLCWGLMELEPVIGGVVMQNLQCKLEDGTRYVSM